MKPVESISIVASMYNASQEALEAVDRLFLPSLLGNGGAHVQLLLLDDASPLREETRCMTARWRQRLAPCFGDVVMLENDENLGFAESYNRLMRRAEGTLILMTNDDVFLPVGAVARLTAPLLEDVAIGTVAPVTDYAFSFQRTRRFPQLIDYSPSELARIGDFDRRLQERLGGRLIPVPFYDVVGFCQSFRKTDLERLDYFDPAFRYGNYEDRDLNKRLEDSGMSLVVRADTFVKHGGPRGGSLSVLQHAQFRDRYAVRNYQTFADKHGAVLAEFMQHRCMAQYQDGIDTIDDLVHGTADAVAH
ncbi:MAG TPA: glycosyltransferase [Rhodocyclaceae bacterium]|nr:glycosyltransferase [Rhodocyclaceae bacterium]